MVFIICVIVFGFVAFAASDTGAKFFNKLNEKTWENERAKADPNFPAKMEARRKTIKKLSKDPQTLNAYAEYLSNLKRNEIPLPLEDFINNCLDSLAGVGKFTLHIDLYGKIESVELEGYGEVPLDMIKEFEPQAYQQIMAEYEKFKRSRNFKD